MKPPSIMVIAGEPSGDVLAAELVQALQRQFAEALSLPSTDPQPLFTGLAPVFFGAGGPRMQAAGVELVHDLTQRSVIGPTEASREYFALRRIFNNLVALAHARQPDLLLLVDYSYFNHKFAHVLRTETTRHRGAFRNWRPAIVKYVSPQVWASRPGRAKRMAKDFDLLLCLFPFEKEWYAARVPSLAVDYVGHPIMDRYPAVPAAREHPEEVPRVLLLPGSRKGELRRHLPVLVEAVRAVRSKVAVHPVLVLPTAGLASPYAQQLKAAGIALRIGGLSEELQTATVAVASTGSVTMECARFGVPTIALYKTSWLTYEIGRRIVTVRHLAMPNLLAGKVVMPEFVQSQATPQALGTAILAFLQSQPVRDKARGDLAEVIASLGPAGAATRAARSIVRVWTRQRSACQSQGSPTK